MSKSRAPDALAAAAVDLAKDALLEVLDVDEVGEHVGVVSEGDRVVTHYFQCLDPGYVGWQWAVTVARASRAKVVTVDEAVLLPGPNALVAPPWVPWSERVRPEDMSPGALLPTAPDDSRLMPTTVAGSDDDDEYPFVSEGEVHPADDDEAGLRRTRVLSPEGRDAAAERWYAGSGGPDDPVAQAAPARCATCGFLVQLGGNLGTLFGVCGNEYSPSDGQAVSFDHGCGAHSEVITVDAEAPSDQPHPVMDTTGYEDVEVT